VNNHRDVYTVDADIFPIRIARSLSVYEKTGVYGPDRRRNRRRTDQRGATAYAPGDYLVFNDPEGCDDYAMKPEKFHELYEK
jgi:hypothetical protein